MDEAKRQALQGYIEPDAPQDSFWKPREGVNMDVQGDLGDIRRIAEQDGFKSLPISSAVRGMDEAQSILNRRKAAHKLTEYSPEIQSIIDRTILRGDAPGNLNHYPSVGEGELSHIKYPDVYKPGENWRTKAQSQLETVMPADQVQQLIDTLGKVRGSFGGFQSGHFSGNKIDIAESDLGTEQFNKLIQALESSGYTSKTSPGSKGDLLREPNPGNRDVLDIMLRKLKVESE